MIPGRWLLALALQFAMAGAGAADGKGLFSIRGAGLLKCEAFVRERATGSPAYQMMGGWLDGYVTALNELSPQTYDSLPHVSTELLTVLLARHCNTHLDDRLFAVTRALLAGLREDRLRESSAVIDVRVGMRQTRLYVATVARVQKALTARGLTTGDKPGHWTSLTTKAMAGYQSSVGLTPTGFPDQATLWRLLRAQ